MLLIILGFLAVILTLIIHYKCWASIPEKFRDTSPMKAILFLFIPLYDFYWLFFTLSRLARSYYLLGKEYPENSIPNRSLLGKIYAVTILCLIMVSGTVYIKLLFLAVEVLVFNRFYSLMTNSAETIKKYINRQSDISSNTDTNLTNDIGISQIVNQKRYVTIVRLIVLLSLIPLIYLLFGFDKIQNLILFGLGMSTAYGLFKKKKWSLHIVFWFFKISRKFKPNIGIAIVLLILFVFISRMLTMVSSVDSIARDHPAYQIVNNYVNNDKNIQEKIGGTIKFGIPMGEIIEVYSHGGEFTYQNDSLLPSRVKREISLRKKDVSGLSGIAYLIVKVKGNIKSIYAKVNLERKSGEDWKIKEISYER